METLESKTGGKVQLIDGKIQISQPRSGSQPDCVTFFPHEIPDLIKALGREYLEWERDNQTTQARE